MIKEKISLKEIHAKSLKNKVIENSEHGQAAFTHYLNNRIGEDSHLFKEEAVQHVKTILEYKFPNEDISKQVAEKALQYVIYDFRNEVPFPEPENPKFSFIDLFAGIGGFRLAMQNLGGKCVFTSEWDPQAKKTYEANFGEVPFGDITKERTKQFIPDGFDILCAGFPCQAFSIAGRRGGFEDTRGTLFFEVAEIIRHKQPKAIFLENVKGLRNHDKGKTLATILNVLREDFGYFVPEPQIINARNFGVPQNRERIFIIGFHPDTKVTDFDYPKPLTKLKTFEDIKEEDEVSV